MKNSRLLLILALVIISMTSFVFLNCQRENSDRFSLANKDQFQIYPITLPSKISPLPQPLPQGKLQPGFRIRGIKGWAWEPEQYLAEIPYLVIGKMNFLMNCYLSMFSNPEKLINHWWEPIAEEKKRAFERVVKACQENEINFCFSLNPQLFTDRPYRYDSEEDFELLWAHYNWMQGLGVRWFNLSFDDIPVEGQDKALLGDSQARLANKLLLKLREKDPEVALIICPVYYWGCGQEAEARAYLLALGKCLHPEIYVFWTGDAVVTTRITKECAQAYKNIVNHRLIIWDNYPVNDRHPVLHLGPLSGRESSLIQVAEGYMSNPLSPQNEINRLPMLTCADYAYNPWEYDPKRSIGQSILHIAKHKSQQRVLKDLVELFPGNINVGKTDTGYNSLMDKLEQLLQQPDGHKLATDFVNYVNKVLIRFNREFPHKFSQAKKTISYNIELMKKRLEQTDKSK